MHSTQALSRPISLPKQILVALLAVALLAPLSPAISQNASKLAASAQEQIIVTSSQVTGAIEAVDDFLVRRVDGTLALAISSAPAGVAPSAFNSLVSGMETVNDLVRQGILATTADFGVYQVHQAAFTPQSVGSQLYWQWWGAELHLSSYWANRLVAAINVGSGVAGVTAIICASLGGCGGVGTLVAGLVAGILQIIGGAIQWCTNSRGVVIKRNWAGWTWCHGH